MTVHFRLSGQMRGRDDQLINNQGGNQNLVRNIVMTTCVHRKLRYIYTDLERGLVTIKDDQDTIKYQKS